MKYIIIFLFFFSCFACCPTRMATTNHIIKDSVIYNVIEKDTTIYYTTEADTIKATQNLILDNLGTNPDTISVLENKHSISLVEAFRDSLNHFKLNHILLQKKLEIEIPVKFVYLDKYVIKNEIKTEEKIIVKYKRDTLFWFSIIINVVFIMMILMKIKKRIGI